MSELNNKIVKITFFSWLQTLEAFRVVATFTMIIWLLLMPKYTDVDLQKNLKQH